VDGVRNALLAKHHNKQIDLQRRHYASKYTWSYLCFALV